VLDEQFYPDGVGVWMTKLDAADGGGIGLRPAVLPGRGRLPRPPNPPGPARRGDAASDSYCYS
jgi:methanethiol oxidase